MNKTFFLFLILLGLLTILVLSCSERKDIFKVQTHPENWLDNSKSVQFHGKAVLETGPDNCQSCHGKNYKGGSSKIPCFSCHELYPHILGWKEKTAHGASIVSKLYELDDCSECHGEDYTGGSSNISCFQCHTLYPHPKQWANSEFDQYHGKLIDENKLSIEECNSCHGTDYKGGSSNVSCFTCHSSIPTSKSF